MKAVYVWWLLVTLTMLTWWAGHTGLSHQWLVIALLMSVFIKGHFLIADFMALRKVALLWRSLVHGWLVSVLGLIFVAYRIGM